MNYVSAATAQERVEFGPLALVSEYVCQNIPKL